MNRKMFAAALFSFVLSVPLSLLSSALADHALHGWRSVFVAPGYALAAAVDEHFPRRYDVIHGDLLPGLGRFALIDIGVNCLLYGVLLYPTVRFVLLPRLSRAIPAYKGDAFWMRGR